MKHGQDDDESYPKERILLQLIISAILGFTIAFVTLEAGFPALIMTFASYALGFFTTQEVPETTFRFFLRDTLATVFISSLVALAL